MISRSTLCIVIALLSITLSSAQELEPRVYANIPKDMNVVATFYGLAQGNVLSDPTKPIEDFSITTHNISTGYVRTFGFAKKLARIQLGVPLIHMSGKLKLNGVDTSGARSGFGDMRVRIAINLLGSNALTRQEFATFQQKTILGVSLITSIPTGLYYPEKLINIGSHRWGFKPEVGISRRFEHFYIEGYTGVWFFTDNHQYLETKTVSQKPVYSLQGHIVYSFNPKFWLGVNGNWFNGGQTTIDDLPSGDLNDNWRIGATASYVVKRVHTFKIQFHIGAFTNTGYDYDMAGVGYQYIFF